MWNRTFTTQHLCDQKIGRSSGKQRQKGGRRSRHQRDVLVKEVCLPGPRWVMQLLSADTPSKQFMCRKIVHVKQVIEEHTNRIPWFHDFKGKNNLQLIIIFLAERLLSSGIYWHFTWLLFTYCISLGDLLSKAHKLMGPLGGVARGALRNTKPSEMNSIRMASKFRALMSPTGTLPDRVLSKFTHA